MKYHIIGFISFVLCWTIGSALLDIILNPIFSRYTGAIGFILGILAWFYYVKRNNKKPMIQGEFTEKS